MLAARSCRVASEIVSQMCLRISDNLPRGVQRGLFLFVDFLARIAQSRCDPLEPDSTYRVSSSRHVLHGAQLLLGHFIACMG